MAATAIELAASAARTESGNGSAVDITNAGATARLDFVCSAVAGGHQVGADVVSAGVLDVAIETGPTGSGPWSEVFAMPSGQSQHARPQKFQSVKKASTQRLVFVGCDAFIRCRWTMRHEAAGFTFIVDGDAI